MHSPTGNNSARRPRQAWQVRFVSDPQVSEKAIKKEYPGMGDRWSDINNTDMNGAKYPLLWPATLAEEDEVRARGHMILTRLEWITLLTSHWRHLVVTLFTRAADTLDILAADHPVYAGLVYCAEFFNIV